MARDDRDTETQRGLSNKRVVVLGGSSGIGLAVAHQAVAQGAVVVIASSSPERVQSALAGLNGKGERHALDLSDEQAIQIHRIDNRHRRSASPKRVDLRRQRLRGR